MRRLEPVYYLRPMPAVLCFGDSNTWGYLPGSAVRLGRDERWPGVLRAELGARAEVYEEGLNGRTSAYEHPLEPYRNGLAALPIALETHAPLDVVAIMLGTNDVFLPGAHTAHDAARGVGALVDMISVSESGVGGGSPAVLVVVPPPFADLPDSDEIATPAARAESERFSEAYRMMAIERDCAVLDLRSVVTSSPLDGIHFDAAGHAAIGRAVAAALGPLLPLPA